MEDGEEYEECVEDEGNNVAESCEGERHGLVPRWFQAVIIVENAAFVGNLFLTFLTFPIRKTEKCQQTGIDKR